MFMELCLNDCVKSKHSTLLTYQYKWL